MSESLGEKQRRFPKMLALLIQYAYARGWELAVGEAERSDEQAELNAMGPAAREGVAQAVETIYKALAAAIRNNGKGGGIRNSLHRLRLAVDLHLYIGGVYQTTTEAHRPLGEFWESIGGTWGGRFGDGNHYSIAHEGIK